MIAWLAMVPQRSGSAWLRRLPPISSLGRGVADVADEDHLSALRRAVDTLSQAASATYPKRRHSRDLR